jgi:P2-related tail formation protein
VQEWFNQIPAGNPYTYRLLLEVNQVGYSQADLQKLLAVVDASKNLRSHLDTIVPKVASSAEVFVAAVSLCGGEIQFSEPAANLRMDGTWAMNGAQRMNGVKI